MRRVLAWGTQIISVTTAWLILWDFARGLLYNLRAIVAMPQALLMPYHVAQMYLA